MDFLSRRKRTDAIGMSESRLTDALEMCLHTIMTDLLLWFTLLSTVVNHSGAGIERTRKC